MTNKEKDNNRWRIYMEIQNNLNKAKVLDEKFRSFLYSSKEGLSFQQCLLEMAEWKDKQFAEEKKEWIEKAQHVLRNILVGVVHPQGIQGFIKQFQQAMEE